MSLDLRARVSLDGAGFEAGLNRLEHAGKHAFTELKQFAAAAFGAAAIDSMLEKSISDAREMVNAAKRLGTEGVEGLQVLKQAAKDAGTELGSIESAFEKINLARAKALNGDAGALAAFGKIGVGGDQLRTMSAAQMFMGPMAHAANTTSPEALAPIFRELMGRSFGEMIPVLQTDFEELGAHMKHLGTIMDTDTAVKLKGLGDRFELLGGMMSKSLAPAILATVQALYGMLGLLRNIPRFLGGATANWSFRDYLKTTPLGLPLALIDGLMGKEAFPKLDLKAGKEAFEEGKEQWLGPWAELIKRLESEADKLKHPKPAAFDEISPLEKAQRVTGSRLDEAVDWLKTQRSKIPHSHEPNSRRTVSGVPEAFTGAQMAFLFRADRAHGAGLC